MNFQRIACDTLHGKKGGGAVAAIERGFQKDEIERASYALSQQIERGEQIVVGVNRYQIDEDVEPELLRVDESVRDAQVAKLDRIRTERDADAVEVALADVRKAAEGSDNLLPVMRQALRQMATIGEVCDTLREVFGHYRPPDAL